MKKRTKLDQKRKFINKSSLKSIELMNEFNNIIRGATSNEITIDDNITSERQQAMIIKNIEHRKKIIIILNLKAHLTMKILIQLMIILQTKNMQ